DQVQEALAETETLYNVSAQLNAASSPQEIIDAIGRPMLATGEGSAGLYQVEIDDEDNPEWAELLAATAVQAEGTQLPVGTRIHLPEFPLSRVWQENDEMNVFIGDADADDRVDPGLRAFLKATDAQSLVVLPLKRGGRWLGMIIGRWPTPYDFDENEQRLYESMAAQASVVLERWLLTAEISKRAEQLEQLANIETALSQATSEEEILAAVTTPFAGQETLQSIMLNYVESDREGRPISARPVAVWQEGGIDQDSDVLEETFALNALDLEHDPVQENVILVSDMLNDPGVGESGRELARIGDFRGMALVSLRTGGRVQGNLFLNWREPYDFTEDDRFFLRQLVEPLAAVVARRQASLAQQQALEETSVLYKAGAELNRARTYDEVVDVLRRYTVAGEDVTTVALVLFDRVWTQDERPEWLEIAAYWSAGPVEDEQERYPLELFPAAAETLRPDAPTFIADLANDTQIDENTRKLYGDILQSESALFVPLWVGGQWIGYVTSAYANQRQISDEEMQRLTTLVGQAAVTVQSINLLEETNRLLASEQRQRRVADTMLRATNRMSGVLEESQIRQVLVEESGDLLRAAVTMYEWRPAEGAFRTSLRRGKDGETVVVDELHPAEERPALRDLFDQAELQLHALGGEGDGEAQRYAIPWLVGNDVAGMLEITLRDRRSSLSQEDRASVVGIVQQAAVRLQGARLFEETEMQAEELAVLNEMGRELTALTDVNAVVETVYDYMGRLMNVDNFYIALHDSETDEISFPLAVEEGERAPWPSRQRGEGLTEYVIDRREPLLILEDVEERLQELGIEAIGAHAESWLGSPLVFGDQVTGVIAVQSPDTPYLYSERDMELLNAVASAAAIAIQNARLFQETQERAAETRALYEASRSINTAQSYEEILRSLREHTVLGQRLHHVTLNYFDRPWTADEEPEWMETLAQWGQLPPETVGRRSRLSDFPPARTLLKGDGPTIIGDMDHAAEVDEQTRALYAETFGAAATLFVPLVVGGQWVGFINAMYCEPVDFADQDVRRLMALAGQAAIAVQSLHLLRDAQRRAQREQILRKVTAEVRSVTDVDLIMKTAVREVGRALGREAFVYLGNGEQVDGAGGNAHEAAHEASQIIEQETE
ncbi:MAG: GAF domain-containing protein, partial [Candidatus Promineifilaceae bacterium]|nr:GAF domain-containing protein [Candidatus Promineifilaceae bacterium]